MWASDYGPIEVVSLLLEKGADVNARDNDDGNTALINASNLGQIDIVKLLLDKGADVNAKTNCGCTALIAAIKGAICFAEKASEFTEVASTLLEKGVDVNAKSNEGETALSEASWSGLIEFVSLLLEKGADVNMKTENGNTALTMASSYENEDVVTVIKKHIHDKLMEEVLKTTLIVKKGLRQKRDEFLVPYAQKEIIHLIASFFYIKTSA